MTAIIFSRTIGPVPIAVVLREEHRASLAITLNPIEEGADVTDHAYVQPKQLELDAADGEAAATYNALVRFQETRQPFTFVSGLYVYNNMLIAELNPERDRHTSKILRCRIKLQEVIIVSTAYTASEGAGNGKSGNPGGKDSTDAARASKERASGTTKDRASGTVQRGDQASGVTPTNQSILNKLFGPGGTPTRQSSPGGVGGV